jgi:predicted nucleic acid-binding protein
VIVVDASVVAAALVESGTIGAWAESVLADGALVAPHLMPAEVVSVLRRGVASGAISGDTASLALDELAGLDVTFYECAPVVERIWELRHTVTAYDAWYVAVAEALDLPLATLDERLAGASGPRCSFRSPTT